MYICGHVHTGAHIHRQVIRKQEEAGARAPIPFFSVSHLGPQPTERHCLLFRADLPPCLNSTENALTGKPKDVPLQCPRFLPLDPIRLAIKINHHIKIFPITFLLVF